MKCIMCEEDISVNGVGPSGSPKFTGFLRTIYSRSCKKFHKCGNLHDLRYHMYSYGKGKADTEFLCDMLEVVRECPWYSRGWYRYQARKFYLAVKYGGQESYQEAQMECLKNMNRKGL